MRHSCAWIAVLAISAVVSAEVAPRRTSSQITDADRAWWAFRPLNPPAPPLINDSRGAPLANPVDAFLAARLQREGRSFGPEPEQGALFRRLCFDLTGLPPTPEQLDEFRTDSSGHAFENAVERLLHSPRYGERQARFWLDLVRYAESDGYKQDAYRGDAWRYRDYVIKSFNTDKPYDRFLTEQLAGDELHPDDPEARVATGFYRACVYEYNNRDARTQWANILAETTDTVGDVFLGLGMQCARCHDHKFDPILQEDYYRLQACFAGLRWRDDQFAAQDGTVTAWREKLAAWETANSDVIRELAEFERPFREKVESDMLEKFPRDLETLFRNGGAWSPLEQQLMYIVARQVREEHAPIESKMNPAEKRRWKELKARLAEAEASKPPAPPKAFAVGEVGPDAPPTRVGGTGETVQPGFLTVLGNEGAEGPRRRAALARWLTRGDHPLTARVIVNRVWQQHFGRGIAGMPSDFGHLGGRPTDPELLDWLAAEFIRNGWHFKALQRLIVNSRFYRCGGAVIGGDGTGDPVPAVPLPRRLHAEEIRDASLAASGELDLATHGQAVSSDTARRSVFTILKRNTPDPLLAGFDAPDTFRSCSERITTTTPTQSLLLVNGQWMQKRARAMARRLLDDHPGQRTEQIRQAWVRVSGREPAGAETAEALVFLHDQRARAERESPPASPESAFVESRDLPRHGMSLALTPENVERRLFPTMRHAGDFDRGGFTAEAVISLRSLPDDATVRTVLARWDGDRSHHGWALGVAGKKSGHTPGALILQLTGEGPEGATRHEVVPSDLVVPLNRPWFVAAAFSPTDVTFAVKDLGDDEATIRSSTLPVGVGVMRTPDSLPLTFGARSDEARSHPFHGLIGEVRLTGRPLTVEQLFCVAPASPGDVLGHWKFEMDGGPLADTSPAGHPLEIPHPPENRDSELIALTDFCHALLNSSEFLYVE